MDRLLLRIIGVVRLLVYPTAPVFIAHRRNCDWRVGPVAGLLHHLEGSPLIGSLIPRHPVEQGGDVAVCSMRVVVHARVGVPVLSKIGGLDFAAINIEVFLVAETLKNLPVDFTLFVGVGVRMSHS